MNIEIMRNTLYKAYLEDFYTFCKVPCELLLLASLCIYSIPLRSSVLWLGSLDFTGNCFLVVSGSSYGALQ
jgi:hypothetical protein